MIHKVFGKAVVFCDRKTNKGCLATQLESLEHALNLVKNSAFSPALALACLDCTRTHAPLQFEFVICDSAGSNFDDGVRKLETVFEKDFRSVTVVKFPYPDE